MRVCAHESESVRLWNALVGIEGLQAGEGEDTEDAFARSTKGGLMALEFGTAGLRAKEGPGWNRMNAVTVALTSQGIAEYLLAEEEGVAVGGGGTTPSVCIGFDGREGSLSFAISAALSFASSDVKVYLFDDLVPTPLLAFATRDLNCRAGVMITASHNPKEYNGYKVYWSNGCQIVPPLDKGIADAISRQDSLRTSPAQWTPAVAKSDPLVSELSAEAMNAKYVDGVASAFDFTSTSGLGEENQVEVVYTPLHGVGSPYVGRMFDRCGLRPFVRVASQDEADKDFPTVSFPNPEEGAGVWTEAFKVADERGVNICVANDPDADRLCCAERDGADWRIFSGNDLGIMLGDWILTKWKEKQGDSPDGRGTPAMLTTAVSARVLQGMCQREGVHFEETLTGFKWLGNRALELQQEGYEVLFAYEEAIGFMIGGTGVVDKDGVAAAAVFVDMLNHVYKRNTTLQEHLQSLYDKYGERLYKQGYFVIDATINTDEVLAGLRREYPSEVGGLKVKSVRDMGTGLDTAEESRVTKLPWSKGDKMITFRFHDNGFCTIRASGTEPKLKYYIDLPTKDEDGSEVDISAVEDNISSWLA
ncbi:phosphoglucomutase [Chloropicon primus]|uniref:phosphoglucomutase (alpha-D-glucose-1,6-bisphosphate-dependent) n=1 Tax=Chloropicon primus TaxID=1764295 RepID=A0A5B8MKC1_9CHLO|nr:phosphoglucomutase [Chloropicon primus]UPQ99040.1 phosphoglucomutase [Chloropicon primus]|eukprot:QDZ19830.1 phosphoglucomutase [Chloropicon primus]